MIPITVDASKLCNSCGVAGFTPGLHVAFDGTHTLTFYDHSVLPAGVNFIKAKVRVTDKFGNTLQNEIALSGSSHTATINTSTLNIIKGVDIQATIIADGLVADGGLYDASFGAAFTGELTTWDAHVEASQP